MATADVFKQVEQLDLKDEDCITQLLDATEIGGAGIGKIRADSRTFARSSLRPIAARIDLDDRIPDETIAEAAKSQLINATVPAAAGGRGEGVLGGCTVVEEFDRESVSFGVLACCNVNTTLHARLFPDQAHTDRLYKAMLNGGLVSMGATEPQGGTDVGGYATTAKKVDGGYVINGEKWCITNAGVAELYIIMAKIEGSKGLSAFLVEADTPGLEPQPFLDKMGWRGLRDAPILIKDMYVDESALMGDEDFGQEFLNRAFECGRIFNAYLCVGAARAALDYTVEYASRRKSFGRPLVDHQSIRFQITDALTALLNLRIMARTVGEMWEEASTSGNFSVALNAAACATKTLGAQTVLKATEVSMSVLGGHAYERTHPVERIFRDSRAFVYTEGTEAVQQMITWREFNAAQREGF